MHCWFAVLTKPRLEGVAHTNLLRQGFECLLPKVRRSVRRGGGVKSRIDALFPRYLFLRADPDETSLASVRSTRGTVGLVRFGGIPARVPEAVVAHIVSRVREDECVELETPLLEVGQRVTVRSGALCGWEAIFKSHEGADRVRLLLELLGSTREIVMPRSLLATRV